ncbi:GNAT family N-acetyltransferase [Lignipirellula cremea]|uniref:N-acetyltransferase domain-containing protein n=1 Tax=Lignipirellula cremea TaxID=2528010 RepID=A0A518E0S7_9BACT|nr:N-acetyltransferase [Lignipirellula cremea]QDU97696.1 hypothetical protein Pla8534_55490 [Lignipirellula cremea]
MITIRKETLADRAAIRDITIDAFANSVHGHQGEADLVDALRSSNADGLSLVAEREGTLVGHLLFSPVVVRRQGRELHGQGLAPLSVLTAQQRRGVGSALVVAGQELLAATGNPFTVVAGDPAYYGRFGFVPAGQFGWTHGFAGMPQEFFQVHAHDPAELDPFRDGQVFYREEFGPQHEAG